MSSWGCDTHRSIGKYNFALIYGRGGFVEVLNLPNQSDIVRQAPQMVGQGEVRSFEFVLLGTDRRRGVAKGTNDVP